MSGCFPVPLPETAPPAGFSCKPAATRQFNRSPRGCVQLGQTSSPKDTIHLKLWPSVIREAKSVGNDC